MRVKQHGAVIYTPKAMEIHKFHLFSMFEHSSLCVSEKKKRNDENNENTRKYSEKTIVG